ncbi:MAG: hypothetical protein NTV34_16730 [Proteobacteria bacterium]|nr:hypothetical protein [Pseudomonadota bacterium]
MAHRSWVLMLGLFATTALDAKTQCKAPASRPSLNAKAGFAEFLTPEVVEQVTALLPKVADEAITQAFLSKDTMWYDEDSMEFLYQDSIESVVGLRANCVGRRVGETNPQEPGIHKLVKYFGPDYSFSFGFLQLKTANDCPSNTGMEGTVPTGTGRFLLERFLVRCYFKKISLETSILLRLERG